MAGRIDVALWTPEGTVIRDYKTGAVYEEVEDGGQDVKIAYQFQLKLYAALHADARGKWPVRLELMTIAGDIVEIPFTRDECEQLFAEAKGRVADLWSRVEDVRSGQRGIEAITSPGDACKWCRYRPVCPAYQPWAESQPREATGRRDTWGTVGRVGTTRRGLAAVELDTNAGPVQVLDLNPSPARNPALTHISEGDPLAVFDVIPVNEQSLRAIDQTVVYRA